MICVCLCVCVSTVCQVQKQGATDKPKLFHQPTASATGGFQLIWKIYEWNWKEKKRERESEENGKGTSFAYFKFKTTTTRSKPPMDQQQLGGFQDYFHIIYFVQYKLECFKIEQFGQVILENK